MNPNRKIKPIGQIAGEVKIAKQKGQKIVHCHGEFDLLHIGHTRYFKAARNFGDALVVTLTPDRFIAKGPGRPVFQEELRAEAIANLEFVDWVGINEWPTAEETLRAIQPDVYVKGSEYLGKVDVTGRLEREKQLIESLGGKMQFTHEIIFSSSKLLNRNFSVFSPQSRPYLEALASKVEAMALVDGLKQLEQKKFVLIGDLRFDEHWQLSQPHTQFALSERLSQSLQARGVLVAAQTLAAYCPELSLILLGDYSTEWRDKITSEMASHVKIHFIGEVVQEPFHRLQAWDENGANLRWETQIGQKTKWTDEFQQQTIQCLEQQSKNADLVLFFDQGIGRVDLDHFLPKSPLLQKTSWALSMCGSEQHHGVWNSQHFSQAACIGIDEKTLSPAWLTVAESWLKSNAANSSLRHPKTLLTLHSGINSYWQVNQWQGWPALLPLEPIWSQRIDGHCLSFALFSALQLTTLSDEFKQFIADAALTYALQSNFSKFNFDRMLLEKFIIALLNC